MQFVLTADWHIRGDRPRCRIDEDWMQTQQQHIDQAIAIAKSRDIPLVLVGDIFNTSRVSTEALHMVVHSLRSYDKVCILAGNHDLPYHSYANVAQSSFGVLRAVCAELGSDEAQKMLGAHAAAPFGLDDHDAEGIVFTHQLVFPSEKEQPFENVGKTAKQLAEEFPKATWIFTGDYHHKFDRLETREDGTQCRVVNPGCLMRQVADYMDYSCSVYIVDTDQQKVEAATIIDSAELVTDSYLREADAKDERLESFLELVSSQQKVSLSFRDNLDSKLASADVTDEVKAEVHTIITLIGAEK